MESTTTTRERPAARALEQPTLCAAFQATVEQHPERAAIRTKGDEVSITWGEYGERVRRLAPGLAALGVRPGGTVAIMLVNRPEFHLVDTAAMHLGAIPFSIYNTYTAEQIEFLVDDAGSRVLVTERQFLDTVLEVARQCDSIEHVVVIDGGGEEGEGTLTLQELEDRGDPDFDFEAAAEAVDPGDVLTLIYTSGTTGNPKGVQITHANLLAAGRSFDELIAFPDGARVISWLPMAHIAERACSHYLPIMFGFTATCCPDARRIAEYLPEVRPSWFFSVPRIWEKLKAGLEAAIDGEQDEQRREAMRWALDVGLRKTRLIQVREQVPDELEQEWQRADELVLSKMRERVGLDQLEACNVGAAPTPPEVIEFFHAIGVPLAELWGMSETCGAGTCNRPADIKIGTVGPPSPGIEVRLAEDGEVLVKGDVVMIGYRNLPDKTAETLDEDGWLHTGDIGEFDDEGFLKIVDRKKELIINSAGKNMSPANIEAKVKAAGPLIGQAMAVGDNRPYNVALITLDPDAAPHFAREHGLSGASVEEWAEQPAVIEEVQREIDEANEKLARVEQIKRFKVLPTEWQPGGDELTPTAKLKRKPTCRKYAAEIDALYAQ
jgi:long-subunit acyl-CoA synthetase (AMP-forming)